MKEGVVYQYRCCADSLKPNTQEVYRYLGISNSIISKAKDSIPKETETLVLTSIAQMQPVLKPSAVYSVFPLEIILQKREVITTEQNSILKHDSSNSFAKETVAAINFANHSILSHHLYLNLKGCSKVVLFAATLGPQVDAMIRRYTKLDSAKAAVLQAIGSMFAEIFVDEVNSTIAKEFSGYKLHPRFSPGYGDVPLSVQSIFFSLLSCTQKIGLTLTDSLVMAPEKSVTAFIGIE